jgi:hypothetical protein
MPYSLIEIYRRFKGACCLHHQSLILMIIALMMETSGTSEMALNFYQTTRRSIPEDSHLQGYMPFTE